MCTSFVNILIHSFQIKLLYMTILSVTINYTIPMYKEQSQITLLSNLKQGTLFLATMALQFRQHSSNPTWSEDIGFMYDSIQKYLSYISMWHTSTRSKVHTSDHSSGTTGNTRQTLLLRFHSLTTLWEHVTMFLKMHVGQLKLPSAHGPSADCPAHKVHDTNLGHLGHKGTTLPSTCRW